MFYGLLSKLVECTPLGPFDRPCAISQTSDQNFKMVEDKEDCNGEFYDQQQCRHTEEVKNCNVL